MFAIIFVIKKVTFRSAPRLPGDVLPRGEIRLGEIRNAVSFYTRKLILLIYLCRGHSTPKNSTKSKVRWG